MKYCQIYGAMIYGRVKNNTANLEHSSIAITNVSIVHFGQVILVM